MTGCESGYSKYGNGCYVVNQTIPGDFLLGLNKFYVAIGKLSYSDAKDIKDILSKRYSKVIASKKFQGFPDSKKESYKLFLETITSN